MIHKIIFGIVMAAYLIIPIVMITRYESVLSEGELFRFHAMPIDPYDSFRGKYIVLRFSETEVPKSVCSDTLEKGQEVYVNISKRDSDFVVINNVSATGTVGENYFKAIVEYTYEGSESLTLDFPFDRFYMNEELAPLAEKILRRSNWTETTEVYVDVRIINGNAVIEDIYVNGKKIVDYLKALPNEE